MSVKKIAKMIIGKKKWLSLKTAYLKIKHPEFFRATKNNDDFKNIHSGRRCFIIGNGPSLNKIDYSLLENEITFTVNQLPRNPNFYKLKTTYHIWSDSRFFNIDLTRDEDVELLNIMKSVKTADNSPTVFYKTTALDMINKTQLYDCLNIRYYNELFVEDLYKYLENGVDLQRALPSFPTVIGYAICIALYMGFSEIYLLGCDCTGFISTGMQLLDKADKSLYAYSISLNEKKRMERVIKQTQLVDELRWYVKIFEDYDIFEKYTKSAGVKIYNAGEGGLLESFERISLNQVLENDYK